VLAQVQHQLLMPVLLQPLHWSLLHLQVVLLLWSSQ
jgi:hypothetical protein